MKAPLLAPLLATLLALLLGWSAAAAAASPALAKLPPAQLQARQQSDLANVLRYRDGLRMVIDYVATQPRLFPPAPAAVPHLLTQEQREAARGLWQRLLHYYLALDSIARLHADYRRLSGADFQARSFQVNQAAFLAQYRAALEFIEATRHEAGLDVLLNEAMPALGLPAGSFDRFKFRYLNVARATEFAAREVLRLQYRGADAALERVLAEDARAILAKGSGSGQTMTLVNALDVVRKSGFDAWFPVQTGVAEWMGDTKVYRVQRSLISAAQIAALPARLEPGDILIERREWYVSNVGLPGYWPHAALYVGTTQERAAYFAEPAVQAWVRSQGEASGEFEKLLARRAPDAYAKQSQPLAHGNAARVIEAISEGVSFTSIEHSADADSLAVLRPRNPKVEKAQALLRAFAYVGRPYDFNFDFRSDAALVCSELVFKAYEPANGMGGLAFPVSEVLGRIATSPNDMVRQFDEQYGSSAQQTELVLFLDGNERKGYAAQTGLAAFRSSWRRPKWHLLTQALATR
jgi:hypothetical protein